MGHEQGISRRGLLKQSLGLYGGLAIAGFGASEGIAASRSSKLRLGGPVFEKVQDPQGWVEALRRLGYSAAYCPVGADASDDAYRFHVEFLS